MRKFFTKEEIVQKMEMVNEIIFLCFIIQRKKHRELKGESNVECIEPIERLIKTLNKFTNNFIYFNWMEKCMFAIAELNATLNNKELAEIIKRMK